MKKYLDNSKFIDWVYNPNNENEQYWGNYLINNPEEQETINSLKAILLAIKRENDISIPNCKEEVFEAIKLEINAHQKKIKPKVFSLRFFKYASIFVIVFGVVGLLFLNNREHLSNLDTKLIVNQDTVTNTQLILGNKPAIVIETEESQLRYHENGNVVINNRQEEQTIKENLNQLIVPFGKRSQLVLSDNSIVHLNAGSKLVFLPDYSQERTRTVYLEGEAYFEVAKNTTKPFIVRTFHDAYKIKVLGTKFNVTAYKSDSNIQTVLKEGSVKVLNKKNVFAYKETLLEPGDLAKWNKNNQGLELSKVNPNDYTSWVNGFLPFNREPMENIVAKLIRYYNIKITFSNPALKQKRITGKLDLKENVYETLKNLAISSKSTIKKINKKEYAIM